MTAGQAKDSRLAPIASFIGSVHAGIHALAPLVQPALIGGAGGGIVPLGGLMIPRGSSIVASGDGGASLSVELFGAKTIQPVRLVLHRLCIGRNRRGGGKDRKKNVAHRTR